MATKNSPMLIGAFVIGAVIVLLGGVVLFGSGQFFSEKLRYVMYFSGSAQGLRTGAPVALKGVQIGTVKEVNLLFDPGKLDTRIQVMVEVEPERVKKIGDVDRFVAGNPKMIGALIKQGLRAQLQLESFVTGMLFIYLDFFPNTPVELSGTGTGYQEIPTTPSKFEEISQTLEELPIGELVKRAGNAIEGIEQIVKSPDLADAIGDLDDTMANAKEAFAAAERVLNSVDKQVQPLATTFREAAGSLDSTLDRISAAVEGLEEATKEAPSLTYELERTLKSLREAARSIRTLADYFERNPNAVIYGKRGSGK